MAPASHASSCGSARRIGSSSSSSSVHSGSSASLTDSFSSSSSTSSQASGSLRDSLLICTEAHMDTFAGHGVMEEGRAAMAAAAGFGDGRRCCHEAGELAGPCAASPAIKLVDTCFQCIRGDDLRLLPAQDNQRRLMASAELAAQRPAVAAPSSACHGRRAAAGCTAAVGAGTANPRRLPDQHRALILGWMREVSEALGLHVSTLFAATSLLDRFMAAADEAPSASGLLTQLQLLVLACMSVAVKYNENVHVGPSVWLGLAVDPAGHNLYQARDLQRCEFSLLQTIDWRLHQPNTHTFLEHYLMCLTKEPACLVSVSGQHPLISSSGAASASPNHIPAGCGDSSVTPSAKSDTFTKSYQQGDGESGDPWVLGVAATALALAELSLLHNNLLAYDHSTIALACVSLALRRLPPPAAFGGEEVAAARAAQPPLPKAHSQGGDPLLVPPEAAASLAAAHADDDAGGAAAAAAAGGRRLLLTLPVHYCTAPPGRLASCIAALERFCSCWFA